MSKLPSVAIVGRPNVGKSTLFNRLIGRRAAVADEIAGVTRDRKEEICEWRGKVFSLVDTGGWETGKREGLSELVARQVEIAVRSADVVLLVVDAASGLLPQDREIAELIRRRTSAAPSSAPSSTPSPPSPQAPSPRVLVVANKADSARRDAAAQEAHALGLGDVVAVSALHGRNTGDLLDRIVDLLGERAVPAEAAEADVPAIAIVGRPNVGKSTLFNRLVAEERSIVSEVPGTTRDAIDSIVETEGGSRYRFIDTAGLKRSAGYSHRVEYYSATRTFESLERADVALLVLDATAGLTHQDQAIAERALGAGCGLVVILNKWDACDEERKDASVSEVASRLRFVSFAPLLRVSALTGRNVSKILPVVDEVLDAYDSRAPTARVNSVLEEAVAQNPPPVDRGRRRRPKVLYGTQAARRPPTFVVFSGAKLPDSYLRYLENRLREGLGIGPTPIKMKVIPRKSGRR